MAGVIGGWDNLVDHLLHAPGRTTPELRDAVFRAARGDDGAALGDLTRFVELVAHRSHRVLDGDVAAALDGGRSEDEVFEVIVTAAAGAAAARRDRARAALPAP